MGFRTQFDHAQTPQSAANALKLQVGVHTQAHDATLDALAALDSTAGLLAQTGADAFAKRTLTAGAGITVTNGTGGAGNPTVAITDVLTAGGPTGSASVVPVITWNARGQLTAVSSANIAITSSAVTDFSEAVDDRVDALIQDGTGISWAYDDGANTLTPTVSLSAFDTADLAEGTNLYFTDERAQDAVGTILTDSDTIDFTYTDATPAITASVKDDSITFAKMQNIATDRLLGRDTASSGDTEELTVSGGIEFTGSGGIRTTAFTGDVTKTAGGTALTIANDAVTYAKMQNVSATDKLLGRSSSGAGDVEEITCTSAGRALLDDTTADAQRTTLGVKPPTVQVFTSSGTWTKPSGLYAAIVEVIGGGGSGGSVAAAAASQFAAGGGGGGGGYSCKRIATASLGSTETVTVGAGGAAPAAGNNNGNAGGTSSFGSHCSATGGSGGTGGASTTAATVNGGSGGTGSSGDANMTGAGGGAGWLIAASFVGRAGFGGAAARGGGGGRDHSAAGGNAGGNYGGGGSGAWSFNPNGAQAGGAGAGGIVIVTEFY